MASSDTVLEIVESSKVAPVKLCTFCNNATNGYDKWLYVIEQDRSPFFPILGTIRGAKTIYDESGKALVCIACFHHLLRQWSSFDRRRVPLQKREYSLVTDEKLSNFQLKREDEIRKEAELKLQEIKQREERIKKEAQERLELYRKREQQIREEAEKRLVQEGEELEKIREEAERQLREEKEQEEKLKEALERDIQLEREKGEYIRREAERLLREEKLLTSNNTAPNVKTELLIKSGRAYDKLGDHSDSDSDINMNPSRSRKMEYDPETGCYRRIVPLDFDNEKVEDIVRNEMKKSEVQVNLKTDQPAWRKAEEKETGSRPDSSLEDVTISSKTSEGGSSPRYFSGDATQTEYQFTVKEETTVESTPPDKNGEFEDEEIRKAGEAIKAKFDEDRKKFERDSEDVKMSESTKRSYERRRRSDDDPERKKSREAGKERSISLEKKLKDMEERRARMLARSSGDRGEDAVTITRSITTESSKDDEVTITRSEESRARRARIREERNKRRLAQEALDKKASTKSSVKLELKTGASIGSSSSDHYPGRDNDGDITFTEKKTAEKTDGEERTSNTTTKTTKTISLSGSLLDEPNTWSHSSKSDNTDDFSFSVKQPSRTDSKEKHSPGRVQEQEVSIAESEPVHSSYAGMDLMQGDADDIVYTVKKTTTITTVKSEGTNEPPSSIRKEIQLEQRPLDPQNDLISWDDDTVDSGNVSVSTDKKTEQKPFEEAKESDPKPRIRSRVLEEKKENDTEPRPKPRERVTRSAENSPKPKRRDRVGEPTEATKDEQPKPKPRGRVLDSPEYKGSLSRAELARNQEAINKPAQTSPDAVDGYRGSLGRNEINRVGSFGRGDLPPVILHDIETDSHEEQPVLEPNREVPVESTPAEPSLEEELAAPVPIPRYQEKPTDHERRSREMEIEEKRRRIMEQQKRASIKRRGKTGDDPPANTIPQSTDDVEDLKEKRRSLIMMWESYSEGEGTGPENRQDDDSRRTSFGYDKMMMEASENEPDTANSFGIAGTMDFEEESEDQRVPLVEIDEKHKLNDDELKWERAGQFQPGRINSKFYEVEQDDTSPDEIVFETKSSWKGLDNNNVEETTTTYHTKTSYAYDSPDQEIGYTETTEVESAPKRGLWEDGEDQTTHPDDDEEDERSPVVELDIRNRLTEEEAKWERAGHFQPGKINTSIFEGRGSSKQDEPRGSQKFKKNESSRYEQIKKIQRTDSKKEMLVPTKVALKASVNNDVEEEDEDERPEIGRIDKSSLIYETLTDEERQRREREERNRREIEEIERERDEERRRREREDRETTTTINDFEDDEFDAKVKAQKVKKIDLSKFGDFQKTSEPVQERKPVSKVTKRISSERIEPSRNGTVESAPVTSDEDMFEQKFKQEKPDNQVPLRKSSVKKDEKKSYSNDVVTARKVSDVESAPAPLTEDEEYELKRRSVGKLNKDWLSQLHEQESKEAELRRKEAEMQRIKQEQYEMNKLKEEEMKRRKSDTELFDNEANEMSDQPQNVKRLDTSVMSPFLKGGRTPDSASKKKTKDEIREERKLARRESRTKINTDEVINVQMTAEVQQSPDEVYDDSPKNVGRLDKVRYLQMMGDDMSEKEKRKKQLEEERVRRELEEMERQRAEEERRYIEDNYEVSSSIVTDKPQSVNKIDLSQFSQFQKKDIEEKQRKTSVKKTAEPAKPKVEDQMIQSSIAKEVHSDPHSYEDDEIVIDEKPKTVGKLDFNKITQSFSEEAEEKHRRLIEMERERIRRENEERELLLREQQRRGEDDVVVVESTEEVQSSPTYFDDEEETTSKKTVGKLDFNKITKSFGEEAEEKRRRLIEMEKERIRREEEERELLQREKERKRKDHSTIQEERPERTELSEDQMYEEKRKSVGKLDFQKITKSFGEEAEEKRQRLIELERERIRREKDEREQLLREEQRHREREADNVIYVEKTSEVHSAPTEFEDESKEEKKKTSVGKLDFEKITKSFGSEAEERRQRLIELEKERIRRENEEREKEKRRQLEDSDHIISANVVQEVESTPEVFEEDNKYLDDKPKNVGKLDFNKITKSFSDEAEEKRKRLAEMERERIRRENEEREILALEKERKRQQKSRKKSEEAIQEVSTQEVQSAPTDINEDQLYEEKRKQVGKLDFNKITKSFGEEAEEKRQRLIELERERIRREKEEKERLLREQHEDDDENERRPIQNGDSSKGEKRQSVSKLDIDNIMETFREDDEMKRRRAIELENERRLRDEEEKLRSRQMERERAHKEANQIKGTTSFQVESAAPGEDIFFEEKSSTKSTTERKTSRSDERTTSQTDRSRKQSSERQTLPSRAVTREYEEDGPPSQTKKSVGRLDLQKFSKSIDEETRERERRGRELEIERLRLEREEMEGRAVNQPSDRSISSNEKDETDESIEYSRPTPKKLDLSKFSAFGGGLRVTKDDTAVKRREKTSGRQPRPKSIAGTSFKGVANGDGLREFQIN